MMKAFLVCPAICWTSPTIGLWLTLFVPVASLKDYSPEIHLEKNGGG
ncbi:MAG: hypothetical protein OXF84_00575 [Bacteroidetes bacterium]|nr:hypothetical protein [Bacteroidota bacterium]